MKRIPVLVLGLTLLLLLGQAAEEDPYGYAEPEPPAAPEPPAPFVYEPDDNEKGIDHAALIGALDGRALLRGEKIYESMCMSCHGTPDRPGSLPASRAFWKEPFKNGHDPMSMHHTLARGLGQMPAWSFLSPQKKYDVIHFVREKLVRPTNAENYFVVTEEYLRGLPRPVGTFVKTPAMVEFDREPRYLRMDFGPVLMWTLQVGKGNIAYKGIAVRLDEGWGGVSRGRAWVLYDHDTMRLATAWSGQGFVNWRGIAFDGSHGTHTSIVGRKAVVNPPGPGWADPATGSFDDPRALGRDGKPYGPLPRQWLRYRGLHLHGQHVVVSYRVGDADVLELPSVEQRGDRLRFVRTLEIGRSSRDMLMRVAPVGVAVRVSGPAGVGVIERDGHSVLRIPAAATPARIVVNVQDPQPAPEPITPLPPPAVESLTALTGGGPPRWGRELVSQGTLGEDAGPFAVDRVAHPASDVDPWQSSMRMGGFDFMPGGKSAAVCTWLGDVWLVHGIDGDLRELRWRRIATGLFQPLGVKVVDGVIHVACRDQIARLHDRNGDGEIDFYECFNSDHQVTEHFHEFAMGLQTDREGNFYYAKSGRHGRPAVVPHHGTLLKVTRDGSSTQIIAHGLRAANGVCVNDDGSFFVTDQEGYWMPKNRINHVRPGTFHGNMWGYHVPDTSDDSAMEQPIVWITNKMDRSPGEVVRVESDSWGPLRGELLELSYGTGRVFLVPHETVNGQMQGGVVRLPIPEFPTGVMRGRFHPGNGHLYACGMFAWAGNRTQDGGFYRVRRTGKPMHLPVSLHALQGGMRLVFTDPLDRAAAEDVKNYRVKAWSLERTQAYGSDHINERPLPVTAATLAPDGKTIHLAIPQIAPTRCMEIAMKLRGIDGQPVERVVHNTIHHLGQ